MPKVRNMFRELSMRYIDGYNKLPIYKKDLFDKTYKKQLASMSLIEQANYREDKITKIETEANGIKVYFNNRDCYLYLPENNWVKTP